MRGSYIIINGIDGAGKGVQVEKLKGIYKGVDVTREPGGTPESEIIRTVLLSPTLSKNERIRTLKTLIKNPTLTKYAKELVAEAIVQMTDDVGGVAEANLYAASREQTNKKFVIPYLEDNPLLLGERSAACSMTYQGFVRGLGMDFIWQLNEEAVKGAEPTLEIFLDLDPQVAGERLANRTEKQDRLDLESMDFHQKAREGYLRFYENYCPYPYCIIDASGSIEETHEKIMDAIKKAKKNTSV